MIVECSAVSGLRLVEANDMRRFKVLLVGFDGPVPGDGEIAIQDDGNALVPIELIPSLPGAPGDQDWLAEFRTMITTAGKSGWIDTERRAIRAHVEKA